MRLHVTTNAEVSEGCRQRPLDGEVNIQRTKCSRCQAGQPFALPTGYAFSCLTDLRANPAPMKPRGAAKHKLKTARRKASSSQNSQSHRGRPNIRSSTCSRPSLSPHSISLGIDERMGITIRITDPAAVVIDMKPRRNRRVRCIRFVSLESHPVAFLSAFVVSIACHKSQPTP